MFTYITVFPISANASDRVKIFQIFQMRYLNAMQCKLCVQLTRTQVQLNYISAIVARGTIQTQS